MGKTKIAITMGDPAGIGPEVAVKAMAHAEVYEKCIPIIVGDREAIEDAIDISHLPLRINEISEPQDTAGEFGIIDLIDLDLLKKGEWEYKKNSALGGRVSYEYITRAISLANEKSVAAVVTAPISKESLHLAGYSYSGHTEIFADQTNTKDFAMLLASRDIHVIHVSTHVSLREACERVTKQRVFKVIKLADEGMRQLGYDNPRIAVAGLNPHCSENGLFGHEEEKEIIPAIEQAEKEGINVEGPVSPDVVFVKCQAGQYDIVVAMYHDQGHIPLKLNGFKYDPYTNKYESVSGINCTIGLPIVRTSVDHGTAFGKAGEGRANEESMLDAIDAAVKMAAYREQSRRFCG